MLILASVWQGLTAGLFIVISVLLIGLVLLQKNRGSGLSGAFGGVGGHSAFGTKTGDFLTWITVGLTAGLLLVAVAANFAFQPEPSTNLTGAPPAAPTTPTPTPMAPAQQPASSTPTPIPITPVPVQPAEQTPAKSDASGSAQPTNAAPTGSTATPPEQPQAQPASNAPTNPPAGGTPAQPAEKPKP